MSLLLVIFVNQAFTVKFSRTLYLTTCQNVQKEKKKLDLQYTELEYCMNVC